MARTSTLRFSGLGCLIGSSGLGYLLYVDRQTTVALHMVEVQSMFGVPIPALLAVLGAILMVWSIKVRHSDGGVSKRRATISASVRERPASSVAPKLTQRPHPVKTASVHDESDTQNTWWTQMRHSCNGITLPPGARIVLDPTRPCPIVLHLEMAPPERCKRAIRAVSAWFATFSIPPRFRVVFDHCPEGPSPRHHMVSGAIASEIDRGGFKVISDRDSVDVLFHHPDPHWKKPYTTG